MSTKMKVVDWKQVEECLVYANARLKTRFRQLTEDLDYEENFDEILELCDKDGDYNYLLGMLEGYNVMAHSIYPKEHKEWYVKNILMDIMTVDKEMVS